MTGQEQKTGSKRRCPLAGPGAKMTRKGFVRCCLRERDARSVSLTAVPIKYVCDDCLTGEAIEQWRTEFKLLEVNPRHDTDLISYLAGLLELDERNNELQIPEGIELLDLNQLIRSRNMDMKADRIPAGNWREMPVEVAKKIEPIHLKNWWKTPMLQVGKRGVCPNCQRPDMGHASYGICGGCRVVVKNLRGFALLTALADQGKRLHDQYMKVSISGQKTELKEEVDMPVTVEQIKSAWQPAVERKIEEWKPEEIGSRDELTAVQVSIIAETDSLREMLLAKNAAYGNSALAPVRIFSSCDMLEQINVRIDDKLSRLMRGSQAGEDVELDLMGYLVLRRVARKMQAEGKR